MKSILCIQNVPYFYVIIINNYCVTSKKGYFLSTQIKLLHVNKKKVYFYLESYIKIYVSWGFNRREYSTFSLYNGYLIFKIIHRYNTFQVLNYKTKSLKNATLIHNTILFIPESLVFSSANEGNCCSRSCHNFT